MLASAVIAHRFALFLAVTPSSSCSNLRRVPCPTLLDPSPQPCLIDRGIPTSHLHTKISFRGGGGVSFPSMHPFYISNDSDKRICRTPYFVPGGMTWHGLLP
ncbi:unnamed protein product, partial [Vitis vinifera]